jgi:hypothetical protein
VVSPARQEGVLHLGWVGRTSVAVNWMETQHDSAYGFQPVS